MKNTHFWLTLTTLIKLKRNHATSQSEMIENSVCYKPSYMMPICVPFSHWPAGPVTQPIGGDVRRVLCLISLFSP